MGARTEDANGGLTILFATEAGEVTLVWGDGNDAVLVLGVEFCLSVCRQYLGQLSADAFARLALARALSRSRSAWAPG